MTSAPKIAPPLHTGSQPEQGDARAVQVPRPGTRTARAPSSGLKPIGFHMLALVEKLKPE